MNHDPRATRARTLSARIRSAAAFTLAAIAGVGFAAAYVTGAGTQWEGGFLATALAGLAAGMTIWARRLSPGDEAVEERLPLASPERDQDALAERIAETVAPRRGLFTLLGLAVSTIGAAALLPVYSLIQPFGGNPARLRRTAWRAGVRLVDSEGRPIRPERVVIGTFVPVFPEGHAEDGDVPAFAVRLEAARIAERPPGPDLGGLVVYSMLCTHAGCPVTLYERGTGHVLCPCHQSAFDLRHGARRVSGPADRALPGLPVGIGDDGFLHALGDFTAPPGPGFWSYP